jgi:hypothetical protein
MIAAAPVGGVFEATGAKYSPSAIIRRIPEFAIAEYTGGCAAGRATMMIGMPGVFGGLNSFARQAVSDGPGIGARIGRILPKTQI